MNRKVKRTAFIYSIYSIYLILGSVIIFYGIFGGKN